MSCWTLLSAFVKVCMFDISLKSRWRSLTLSNCANHKKYVWISSVSDAKKQQSTSLKVGIRINALWQSFNKCNYKICNVKICLKKSLLVNGIENIKMLEWPCCLGFTSCNTTVATTEGTQIPAGKPAWNNTLILWNEHNSLSLFQSQESKRVKSIDPRA